MPARFYEDGFDYEYGSIHGSENWTALEVISDITGYELDENDCLYIEDIGFCDKQEVMGRESSLEEMIKEHKDDGRFSFDGNPNCYVRENEAGELVITHRRKDDYIEFPKSKFEKTIYRLEDGNYSTNKPILNEVDLKEYFGDIIKNGKPSEKEELEFPCGYCITVEVNKDGSFKVENELTKESGDLSLLDKYKVYVDENDEYTLGIDEEIDEYFINIDTFDSEIERMSEPDERDDYDYDDRDYDY